MAAQTKSRTRSRASSSRASTRNTRANGATGGTTRSAEANARSNEALFEETADRVRGLNERIIEATHKTGTTYLDAYEKTLRGIADYEEKVAEASQVEWLSALLTAQADFTREIAKATTASARQLLK